MSFRLPDILHKRALAMDPDLPAAPILLHLSDLPSRRGALAFAAAGQVWIAPRAFRPRSRQGLALIGHELAHLAQQSRMGAMPAGVLADAGLEAAADAFGDAFAETPAIDAPWVAVAGPAAAPSGVVQCSYGRPGNMRPLAARIADDAFLDDEEDEEEDEATGPGARDGGASHGKTAKKIAGPTRAVVGGAVSAVNTTSGVLGGTGIAGGVTGALSAGAAAAMAPAAAVLGPAGIALMIADIALSAASAASTYSHITALEKILRTYEFAGKQVRESTLEAIAYALNKKNKKLKRKGLGCIPILGSICNSVYTLGRTIQKRVDGTRGTERRSQARTLWLNMMAGDPAAIAACQELLGVAMFTKIRKYSDGDVVLKKKLKSL
ncbi:eCIS core domain-containing protein [Humitalea sp. 24SJ18S-53]|uniref:eCIS core domain-containing protein n=1 Tax=Humitalea sp. 24SJ18S-53 TaxID=3422307 RepID=UPI003D6774F7